MVETMNAVLLHCQPSGIRKFTALAKEEPGCLFLTIGEPDFNTPDPVKEAAKDALDQNLTHYPPGVGESYLLERISRFEREHNGVSYSPQEIIVTDGATEGLYLALRGILNPSDEVIVPIPAFGLYEPLVTLSQGRYVPMDTCADGFQITAQNLSRHITARTKAILLNSPNNPTGAVYTLQSLEAVYQAVKDRDIFVICDDVYAQLVYGPYQSFSRYQDLREKIILVQSFSKPYAMTGWRVGYLCADRPVIEQLAKLHSYTVVSAVSFLQKGCAAALDYDPSEMIKTYRRRRDYVYGRLLDMGMEVQKPDGAFYLFPSIRKYQMDSETFCLRMIREGKLAAVPGSCFGADGYIRLSYCYADEQLRQSLDRLESFLKTLSQR
ncbi:MAG: aminotransferase class I/II-fold pyridoxal phosphate-dependent enzyme [Oscillospiraceae bacterium]|nr:aminotransferase class I/II-fold pyridoxal phosphate-dependent enzyme [Oscillospiraceae bacterium]